MWRSPESSVTRLQPPSSSATGSTSSERKSIRSARSRSPNSDAIWSSSPSARRPSRSRSASTAWRAPCRSGSGRAGQRDQREHQRDLERGRGGEPGAARHVAAISSRAPRSGTPAPAARRPRRARTRASRRRRPGRASANASRSPRSVATASIRGSASASRADRDALADRERQREPLVVVGVLADQVDAAGGERDGASGIAR